MGLNGLAILLRGYSLKYGTTNANPSAGIALLAAGFTLRKTLFLLPFTPINPQTSSSPETSTTA